MAAIGTYEDPAKKYCFEQCTSCFRCDRKRELSGCHNCKGCSGRPDPLGFVDPIDDDYCDCRNGKLRWVRRNGEVIIRDLTSNPFKGEVDFVAESRDEADWRAWRNEQAEKLGIEGYDPIKVYEE